MKTIKQKACPLESVAARLRTHAEMVEGQPIDEASLRLLPSGEQCKMLAEEIEAACTDLERLRAFAQVIEPYMANIAFNNRPHSEEFRKLYDVCVEARDVIYK